MATPARTRVLIIGTGFSGIGMGIALKKAGIKFLILEKANDVGGTWRDNTYPGAACDIPSHLYSFSFEPNPNWEHIFSYGPEIERYLKAVADKYKLKGHIAFDTHVVKAEWDDKKSLWHVFTEDGREYVAQFLVSGIGALHIPSIPNVQGREEFDGAQFHTAEWDHTVDLAGKRVAVIGTGASAIQVVPAIVDEVGELQLYQRTPAWVAPRTNYAIPPWVRRAFRVVPGLRRTTRWGIYGLQELLGFGMTKWLPLLKVVQMACLYNLRRSVKDPELRRKLTPRYTAGCKRILNGSDFYRAVQNRKTTLITDGIEQITRDAIVTANGTEHPVDVIVWATGFHVTDSYKYLDIKGADGKDLVELWNREGTIAHRGITVAGMPNLFFLLGPNTGLGHNSVVIMIEAQIKYVVKAIKLADKRGAASMMPKQAAQDDFNAEVQHKLEHTVWNTGGCRSWYLDGHGKNRVLWSGNTPSYMRAARKPDPDEYDFV